MFFKGQLVSEDRVSSQGVETRYIQSDQVGSTSYVSSEKGALIAQTKDLPFGERWATENQGSQAFIRYAGHEDGPGDAVYMQARMYLPAYGRFASPDPAYDQNAGDTQSWNLYSYVRNNPITNVDPTGETGLDVILGGIYAAADNITLGAAGWYAEKVGIDVHAQNRDFYIGATIGSIATGIQGTGIATGGSGATLIAAASGVGIPIAVATGGVAVYGGAVAIKSAAAGAQYASMAANASLEISGSGNSSNGGQGEQTPSGKPSVGAHKEALKEVHGKVGKLPKGEPGKFGSPQAGNSKKGYRLDPGHPGKPAGDPEAGAHINYWDYTKGKRGSGGTSGVVPIKER